MTVLPEAPLITGFGNEATLNVFEILLVGERKEVAKNYGCHSQHNVRAMTSVLGAKAAALSGNRGHE
jgi:hypothetical protein